MSSRNIGVSVSRINGPEKVHGKALFTDDYRPPGMLYAALLTSPHAHALLLAHPQPEEVTIRSWLESNLCLCTGYEGIERAVKAAASRDTPVD